MKQKTSLRFKWSVVVCLLSVLNLNAQDLIVTAKNDSINAYITKEKKDFLYFSFKKNDEIRETLLHKDDVKKVEKAFYRVSEVPNDYKVKSRHSKLRLALQGGYSYIIPPVFVEEGFEFLEDYYKSLKSGKTFGTHIHYFFNENWGLGFMYNQFMSYNSDRNPYFIFNDNPNVTEYGIITNIGYTYVGPSFAGRYYFGKADRFQYFYALSAGSLKYTNKEQFGTRTFVTNGSTLGFLIDYELNYKLYKNLWLGLHLSFNSGDFNRLDFGEEGGTIENYELEETLSASRVNLSIGVAYEFKK